MSLWHHKQNTQTKYANTKTTKETKQKKHERERKRKKSQKQSKQHATHKTAINTALYASPNQFFFAQFIIYKESINTWYTSVISIKKWSIIKINSRNEFYTSKLCLSMLVSIVCYVCDWYWWTFNYINILYIHGWASIFFQYF